ncbi:uncharacterized protein EKO05_0000201 [Ascochyta rabiei]|uniref:Uncharacterized protein n=1 Tax=Didymella rabiei TaxID=5454 RepID=A0A163M154_DIDRA|nr:uncharacterized protein EKO05_0000201 [Ascochyta rabiei]KZM28304.1 hypothetical protein ST47_g553 [Ascochyta rabiei]UPX09512.1 hypothetical protein EKO05_0000201 [Ascochyta rabiei]
MLNVQIQVSSALRAMLVTGIILAPAVMATPAVQDLVDLRVVINAAANTIGDLNNPNRGWGLFGDSSQMGTANLINNVTSTILQSKFQIDTNKTAWLDSMNVTNATDPSVNTTLPSAWTPTLPLSSSMALPSTLPTSTPTLENTTTDLSTPYTDYVSSIPNLSTSLTSLGRAWHREMNSPVSEAIGVLQESITTLQTTMLQNELIDSSAILRTIRASGSLESAQQAWSRFLNLPGRAGGSDLSEDDTLAPGKRSVQRLAPANGKQYTHKELWGRKELSKIGEPNQDDAIVEWEAKAEDLKRGTAQPFSA